MADSNASGLSATASATLTVTTSHHHMTHSYCRMTSSDEHVVTTAWPHQYLVMSLLRVTVSFIRIFHIVPTQLGITSAGTAQIIYDSTLPWNCNSSIVIVIGWTRMPTLNDCLYILVRNIEPRSPTPWFPALHSKVVPRLQSKFLIHTP